MWKCELNQGNLQCKFYVIIPRNCSIPSKLGDSDKHRGITIVSDLPVVEEPRAGVTRRYINSVYKIENEEGVWHYAICEYVTIIDTLFQMSLYTEFNAQKRDDQCRLLVRKLTELIDSNEDCRNKCVIVPFSGADDGPLLRDVLLDKIKENRVQIN
ncbi:stimulator of interferon genes protein 3-like [Antedon mediterranea]|uniref:stimulator of interferon genes protein 3-like n=1 Tax=Antedon mediterranea TaxID=105859 RepID=UPI003AF78ACC